VTLDPFYISCYVSVASRARFPLSLLLPPLQLEDVRSHAGRDPDLRAGGRGRAGSCLLSLSLTSLPSPSSPCSPWQLEDAAQDAGRDPRSDGQEDTEGGFMAVEINKMLVATLNLQERLPAPHPHLRIPQPGGPGWWLMPTGPMCSWGASTSTRPTCPPRYTRAQYSSSTAQHIVEYCAVSSMICGGWLLVSCEYCVSRKLLLWFPCCHMKLLQYPHVLLLTGAGGGDRFSRGGRIP